jgi:two-component system, NtrC family, response regulator AtoC
VEENTTITARLLVVSRESAVLRPLWNLAESNNWHIGTAVSAWDAIERVQSGARPHLLVLDLPGGDGDCLHVLRWFRRLQPDLKVIVISSAEDVEGKRDAMRLGAQEILIRPFDDARLKAAIQRHLGSPENGIGEIASEDIVPLGEDSFFVSASPVTQKLKAQAQLLAEADVPVLIVGEVGSGKNTVARLIHKLSVRSGFKFFKVNCADMPAELLEAELFGSTGASYGGAGTSPGKLERAQGGTVFLAEITELPLSAQEKLMQVLQEKILRRTGTEKAIPIDVRILTATSANLDRALSEGRLREDLYYRLSAFTVQVPALRQRSSEIAVLLQHVMHQMSKHYGLPAREFPAGMLNTCQRHTWPGNLQELENFVKRYLVSGNRELSLGKPESSLFISGKPFLLDVGERGPSKTANRTHEDQAGPMSLKSLLQSVKSEAERNAIEIALQKTGWNRKAAARLLQVSYRTLLYKIDEYQMSASESFLSPNLGSKHAFQGTGIEGNGKGVVR